MIRFSDGTFATLYCYKTHEIPRHTYMWHVAGFSGEAVLKIAETLGSEVLESDSLFDFHCITPKDRFNLGWLTTGKKGWPFNIKDKH